MTRQLAEDIAGGIIAFGALGYMVMDMPWWVGLLLFCAILT
jgi:hypothetical protein